MGKKLFSFMICALFCLTLLPIAANAYWLDDSTMEYVTHELNGGYIRVQKSSEKYPERNGHIIRAGGLSGDVVLPETVEGITIIGIYTYSTGTELDPENAEGFSKCDEITSLTIPGTVKSVSGWALPERAACTVILEEGVETFWPDPEGRLQQDRLLEKMVLPASLRDFGGRPARSTQMQIELHPDNPYYTVDAQGLMITADGKKLAAATSRGDAVQSYTVPYGVEEMNINALMGCTALTDVYFPDSMREMLRREYGLSAKRAHARSGSAIEEYVTWHNASSLVSQGYRPIEFVSTGEKLPYTDIGTGWAVPYIGWAYDKGVMMGTGKTTFSPENPVTRGMAVTTLYRLAGETGSYRHPFTDVKSGAYYNEAVAWAAENDIVNGVSATRFAPDSNITREQMAVILFRYAQYLGMDTAARADLDGYADSDLISDYALEAMQWANAEEIVKGVTETTLSPQGITTRAQYAAVLNRLAE